MFRYRVAGVVVASEVPLDGFPPLGGEPGAPAVRVLRSHGTPSSSAWTLVSEEGTGDAPARLRRWESHTPQGPAHRLRFDYREHAIEFVIRGDGGEVSAWWTGAVSDEDVAALLAGPILGRALRLRGVTCLHATVLDAGGSAIALMGPSRVGKSTLAAALIGAGARMLTDDMAALSPDDGSFLVHPGQRRLRLWGDAARRLGDGGNVARIWPGIEELEKFVIRVDSGEEPRPLPLAAVYLLRPREPGLKAPRIAPLDPAARLVALAAHVYGDIDPGREGRAREMSLLGRVAAAIPVRALTLPDRLEAVDASAAALLPRLLAAAP